MNPSPDTPTEVIQASFAAQAEHSLALRTSSARVRIDKLKRLQTALLKQKYALHQAFASDFGKPAAEVDLTELLPVVDEIHATTKHLRSWMRPRWVSPGLTTLGTSARVTYQGKGRCLIIGPWNYPVATLISPLVSAIAAGNTVILKPSEFTPAVNAVLAEVIAEVFDATEVTMITGAAATAQALLDCPFDHIFFTGSSTVGKLVMTAAARHLASVTLELGGKSPVIVDETADITQAAELIMWGKLVNAGQSCIAPDTLFVHRQVRDELLHRCTAIVNTRYGHGDAAIASSPDLARMIHQRHAARVAALIDDALDLGAKLGLGGGRDLNDRFIAPTLLTDVPPEALIAQEEIFGPVLPVIVFDDIAEVITHVNAHPKPLALYLWSTQKKVIQRVQGELSSGSLVINHCMQQFAHSGLPFGGVGNSGVGNSHGIYGFKAFSHERALLRGGKLLPVKLFFPPYTPTTKWLIGALIACVQRL
jgi:aldehyde dehydrogenase (NAD+)